jgi:hypothetical protein
MELSLEDALPVSLCRIPEFGCKAIRTDEFYVGVSVI